MFVNYIKIAYRNLAKHRGYSIINVSGLAIGIACCLLIFLYVKDELTYDRYHSKEDRIFRISSTMSFAGEESTMGASGFPEGKAYLEGIPEIEAIVRFDDDGAIVNKDGNYIQETAISYTDQEIFDVFDFKVLNGALVGALVEMNSVVLTKKVALKYFGSVDIVGSEFRMNLENKQEAYFVTAVIDNHPSNSSFNFDILVPWSKRESQLSNYRLSSWSNISINTYVLLRTDSDVQAIEEKMNGIRQAKNPGEQGEFARNVKNGLQPLRDIHLNTELDGGDGLMRSNDSSYSYILSGIALIILIVACINFTNLSVARSLPRAKEIGVRKVLGAHRKQLAFQFLNEALIMCLIAFLVGLVLAEFALPIFGELTQKTFYHGITGDPILTVSCLILVIITAFLSGFYPSFIVSRFNTLTSLKGKVRIKGNAYVSKSLVVVQFAIAAALVIGTIVMNRQIDHMVNMDLGYNDENVIRINAYGSGVGNLDRLLKAELGKNPGIEQIAAADDHNSATGAQFGDKEFFTMYNDIDDAYLNLMEIPLLEGRKLRSGNDLYINQKDTFTNVLVNEAFVKESELEDPIYKTFSNFRIVGVIRDYYYQGVKGKVNPLMLTTPDDVNKGSYHSIFVKYSPDYLPQINTVLQTAWEKYVPYRPFESYFVQESNSALYENETRWKRIITYASVLAIFISALGLFGLAHLTTQQKIKEIGIRKVLGASIAQIILLLNSSFAKLVMLSVLLASPIAYYFIEKWLQDFANKIDLSVFLFLLPGLMTFGIAFLTVTIQSLKSANSNPVNALRHE